MISVVVLLIAGFFAYKTNPDENSFKSYAESSSSSSSSSEGESKGFLARMFKRSSGIGAFDRRDFGLFSLVSVKRDNRVFLGVYGLWFPMDSVMAALSSSQDPTLPTSAPSNSTSSAATVNLQESFFQQALEYKRKRSSNWNNTLSLLLLAAAAYTFYS